MIQAVVRTLNHKGSDVASASTTDIGAVEGSYLDITGSTTVTGLGTVSTGITKILQFDSTPLLVHSSTVMGLPTSANITAATGDHLIAVSLGSGNWVVPFYQRKNGLPLSGDFPDSFFRVVGSSDATKKLAFEVDGFTGGQTRTVTFPDANLTFPAVTTKGDLVAASASGTLARVAVSATDGDVLIADSTASPGVSYRTKITNATVQGTTSGATIDFNSIPAWAKKITVMFVGVSTTGTDGLLIQIGDAGGIENSGYLGAGSGLVNAGDVIAGVNYTTGFGIPSANAGNVIHGAITLYLVNAATFTWVCSYSLGMSSSADTFVGGGSKSLTATLDRVRITTVGGTDTFDAGSINVMYE